MKKLAAVALAALMGATASAHAEVTLDVVHAWPGHNSFHEAVAKEFMAKHPDIKIEFRASPSSYDEAHQALLRGALTGQLPDVYYSGYHLLPEVVNKLSPKEQVVALDELMAGEGADWVANNYEPSILTLGTYEGKVWGLPFNASTPIYFYNADLVRKAGGDPDNMPTDWNGIIALAGKVDALGGEIDGMAYDVHAWPDDWLWRALILQQGASFMEADGATIAWAGDTGKTALELAVRFAKEGGMALRDFEQSRQQFVAGQVGIIFASVNSSRAFGDLVGDRFELMSNVYPVADPVNGRVPTGGNAAMIMAKDDAKKAAAWEFVKFVASPEGQTIAVLGSGYMPTNKGAMAPELLGDFYAKNPNWHTSIEQVARAVPWGGYPGSNGVEIWRMQREIISQVMRGEKPVDAGLAELAEKTGALIGK